MIRRPPRSTRTDTLLPYTTLFRSGTVEADEVNAYQFTSTAGNPGGQVNAYRIVQSTVAPYQVQSKGKALYLQDTWTMNKWTVNAGVRAEEWSRSEEHTSELQSLMRISYAVFCLKKKTTIN